VIEGMRERGFGRSSTSPRSTAKGPGGSDQLHGLEMRVTSASRNPSLKKTPARGITVNTVCPGYIATDMVKAVPKEVLEKSVLPLIPVTPPRRTGRSRPLPWSILVAEESGFITGYDAHHQWRAIYGVIVSSLILNRRWLHGYGEVWRLGGRRRFREATERVSF